MDRLTERFSNGQGAVDGCGKKCKYEFMCTKDIDGWGLCPTINNVVDRLADYEDVGLTPEEIKYFLKDFGISLCMKNRELQAKINRILKLRIKSK